MRRPCEYPYDMRDQKLKKKMRIALPAYVSFLFWKVYCVQGSGKGAYNTQYIRSMQINTDRNRLNPDWVAKSVHLFLGIYPFIYRLHMGAYAIRPYRVMINFYR